MFKSKRPRKKLIVEFEPLDVQVDIKSSESKALITQLILKVTEIGLRLDPNSINSNIISENN